MEPIKLTIEIGEPRDYAGGNLLNAIDDIVCWFQNETDVSDAEVSDLLELYAGRLSHGKL